MMSNYQVAAENNQQTSSISNADTEILTWDNGHRTGLTTLVTPLH